VPVFDEQAEAGGRGADVVSGRAPANRATHCPRTTGTVRAAQQGSDRAGLLKAGCHLTAYPSFGDTVSDVTRWWKLAIPAAAAVVGTMLGA
jgi:hypothetical protein